MLIRCQAEKHHTLFIFPKRDLASFLSDLPDSVSLTDVCLPGTHDTMAFYGWPLSQCQSSATPLSVQLLHGIRMLDIRLAVIKGKLIAYHGSYPQRTPFQSILADLHSFLSASATCQETIVVSIKQEDSEGDFSRLVRAEIEAGPGGMGMWWLENRIPALGEVRGRAILFSRFGGNGSDWEGGLEGLGIHPTTWPDSAKEGFEWWCKDTLVRTQDWYRIPTFLDVPEKTALATTMLLPSPQSSSTRVLSITYFSASSPLAMPPIVATGWGWPSLGFGMEGVNSRVARFLLAQLGRTAVSAQQGKTDEQALRAWTLLDFYLEPAGFGLVPLLVECNFHGR
ncbi:PLC-like phosphodiesterase [Vararia minispora EC-137]|uniref:PLC-like phosphodiesterase n=1 Tax=Vararia minispora EC-137 TaxID=1314806 RepID=A0ACB8QCN6_9AGAM|nr:PLC-like phosphodiesterase [Vararia minispora EC-137]